MQPAIGVLLRSDSNKSPPGLEADEDRGPTFGQRRSGRDEHSPNKLYCNGKSEASLPLASLCLPTGPTVAACPTLRDPHTRMALVTAHSSSTPPPLPTGTLEIATTIACIWPSR